MTLDKDEAQDNAVIAALQGRDRIITGGAGSGKSTLVKRIAEQFNGNCEIMAPTGKAAARLKEATGFPACTIHRALCYDGDSFHRTAPLGVTIIDEASMIDSWLMQSVLRFNPKQLILVGDSAQLPPVGKGQPFHDLIKLRPDIVSTLKTCHRAKGAVHMAALAIREGIRPDDRLASGGETWTVINTGGPNATLETLLKWIQAGRYDATQDMILAPRYGDGKAGDDCDGGIDAINTAVKALVNPSTDKFSTGDRVINGKNFSNDDYWNGDVGTITDMDTAGFPEVTLDRDPKTPRILNKDHLKELRLAYALSVHKAQGSQARRVFFMCFSRHFFNLSRALIYTAVTRSRSDVVVCGEVSAFYKGIKQENRRVTVMQVLAQESQESLW